MSWFPFFLYLVVTILYCSDIVWPKDLSSYFFCFLPIFNREFSLFFAFSQSLIGNFLLLISCISSLSIDDDWSSCWIRLRFPSEDAEDAFSVSSSEVSISILLIYFSMVGSRLRFLNFFFNLQYLLMWPYFPQL